MTTSVHTAGRIELRVGAITALQFDGRSIEFWPALPLRNGVAADPRFTSGPAVRRFTY